MERNVHLKVTAQCLSLLGFWPLQFKNRFISFSYALYSKITVSIFAVFVFSQFIEIYKVMGKGLEEISSLMAINFLYTLGLAQIWVIRGPIVQKLVKKIQITEENILKNNDEEVIGIFMEHVTKNRISNKLILFLGLMCYSIFNVTPTFTELINPPSAYFDVVDNDTIVYRERPLPLVSWFPFDRYKYYDISFTWHAVAGCVNTAYIVSCKNMFFSLMIFIEGQIKILQHSLLTFKTKEAHAHYPTSVEEAVLSSNLQKSIEYHNAIIKFVDELDDSLGMFLLLDFAACALEIAMIGFEIAVAEISFQLLKNVVYMAAMLTQLCLFYWRGNEVLLESTRVADAIWESEWYECSISIRKMLLQIMVRAQRPLRLSVGSFYHMSTQTMVTIIRSGYSYAAVMRQFYTRRLNN